MDELAGLLSRERLLLELLVFKLVELRQLLLGSETRFLGWASEEVERAVGNVRDIEIQRSMLITGLAAERGVPEEELSLTSLAETSPEPWRSIFGDHRTALLQLSSEVQEHLSAGRRLAASGTKAVADTLERLAGPELDPEPALTTYGPGANWQYAPPAPRVERTL